MSYNKIRSHLFTFSVATFSKLNFKLFIPFSIIIFHHSPIWSKSSIESSDIISCIQTSVYIKKSTNILTIQTKLSYTKIKKFSFEWFRYLKLLKFKCEKSKRFISIFWILTRKFPIKTHLFKWSVRKSFKMHSYINKILRMFEIMCIGKIKWLWLVFLRKF